MTTVLTPRPALSTRTIAVPTGARWEWRTFIDAGLVGASVMAAGGVRPNKMCDETYLLSRHTTHMVVVRDEQLQVRRLVRTDDAGLELWEPTLMITIPATGRALRPVWDALGVSAEYVTEEHYTFPDLLRQVILCHPDLRAVTVTTLSSHLSAAECEVEHTRMLVRGRRLESLAFAHASQASVRDLVRRLGLEGRPNVNYSRMLKCVMGLANGVPPFDWGLV